MWAMAPSSASISGSAPAMSVSTSAAAKIGGAGKAAIEMRRDDAHAPEREVAEAGIELRLRMARQEAAADAGIVGAFARDRRKTAQHRQARMRQGVALAGLGQQQRGAAIDFEIGGVGGQLRHQDQRRAVDIGRHIDQRGEGIAGIAVERRQRAGAGRAQQRLGDRARAQSPPAAAHFPACGPAWRRARVFQGSSSSDL